MQMSLMASVKETWGWGSAESLNDESGEGRAEEGGQRWAIHHTANAIAYSVFLLLEMKTQKTNGVTRCCGGLHCCYTGVSLILPPVWNSYVLPVGVLQSYTDIMVMNWSTVQSLTSPLPEDIRDTVQHISRSLFLILYFTGAAPHRSIINHSRPISKKTSVISPLFTLTANLILVEPNQVLSECRTSTWLGVRSKSYSECLCGIGAFWKKEKRKKGKERKRNKR